MAVIEVTELWDGRSYSAELDKSKREYVRTFRVVTDDPDDGGQTACSHGSIPTIGTAYITAGESDAGAFLKRLDAKQDQNDPLVWIVTANYDSQYPDPEQAEENPLLRPNKYKFGFSKVAVAVQQDLDGRAFVNSAGQPFLPPQEIEITRPTISIEKNSATHSFTILSNLQDCVNSVTWNGFPVGSVKIDNVEATSESENGVTYWKQTWQFTVNWEGWIPLKVLDCGFYEMVDGSTGSSYFSSYVPGVIDSSGWQVTGTQARLRQIRDAFGTPLNSPSLLCGGRALPPEYAAFPCYRYFRTYRWHTFSGVPT